MVRIFLWRYFLLFFLFLIWVNVRFEKIWDVSDILWLKFFFINWGVINKGRIQKIFGSIIMIHTDVFKFEFNFDEVIGEIWWEFNQLVSEIFYKLIVNVGYPCLQSDGDVLEQKMNAFFLLKDRLKLDQLFIF